MVPIGALLTFLIRSDIPWLKASSLASCCQKIRFPYRRLTWKAKLQPCLKCRFVPNEWRHRERDTGAANRYVIHILIGSFLFCLDALHACAAPRPVTRPKAPLFQMAASTNVPTCYP